MQLKLSTLVIIIVVLFFVGFYFIQPVKPQVTIHKHAPTSDDGTGVTEIRMPGVDYDREEFGVTEIDLSEFDNQVTPIDINDVPDSRHADPNYYDSHTVEELAGNIRPDNVTYLD